MAIGLIPKPVHFLSERRHKPLAILISPLENLNAISIMRKFIAEQKISKTEPIIIAGDFNINKLAEGNDYKQFIRSMMVIEPEYRGPNVTFDLKKNQLAKGNGANQYLDYILPRKTYLSPLVVHNKVVRLKAKKKIHKKGKDLSDHYPVFAEFYY